SQWFSSRNHVHACQLVREQANADYIRTRLTEADERDRPYADAEAGESALYEVDGHLFFDMGAENIVHEVLRVQSALSGHPLLDEDRMAVLEDGILSRHIESEVGALDLDEKVEQAAIEETYRAHAEAVCPDCAEVDMAEVLDRSEEHTSELQSRENLVCRRLLEKKKIQRSVPVHLASRRH